MLLDYYVILYIDRKEEIAQPQRAPVRADESPVRIAPERSTRQTDNGKQKPRVKRCLQHLAGHLNTIRITMTRFTSSSQAVISRRVPVEQIQRSRGQHHQRDLPL